jgi:hypothetical protein
MEATTRTFDGRREEVGSDWEALEAIDMEEALAMDSFVAQLTAGAADDNYADSVGSLL